MLLRSPPRGRRQTLGLVMIQSIRAVEGRVHGGLRLNLIPRPDRGRILNIPLVCAPDEAFRLWFETLPDVPWKDPLEPESAS
jgi:hypothetical protein